MMAGRPGCFELMYGARADCCKRRILPARTAGPCGSSVVLVRVVSIAAYRIVTVRVRLFVGLSRFFVIYSESFFVNVACS